MKRILMIFLAAAATIAAAAATYTVDNLPDVHRADRTQFVANPDGIISPAAVDSINRMLAHVRQTTSAEPMVVAVDNISPDDINTFATELFEKWGLGKADKDNGLLVLIVKDLRLATIRTGYGLEGVLPDITCGRIIRTLMAPEFREGDYSRGTVAAVDFISLVLLDPDHAAEYASTLPDADNASGDDSDGFTIYLLCSAGLAFIMLLLMLLELATMNGKSDYDRYRRFIGWKPIYLMLTFAGLGIPAIASVPLVLMLNHWRNHKRLCPGCGTPMTKVDEVHDNDYLTPAQDLEEKIGSVDYDVWLCPNCGETDILPYVNESSQMIECENCHARTARLKVDRIVEMPTSTRPGKGVREYDCLNCHHTTRRYYKIPVDSSKAAAVLGAAAILGSSGRGGGGFGGFGGGSFGGGFGGGSTGGGGATGGW